MKVSSLLANLMEGGYICSTLMVCISKCTTIPNHSICTYVHVHVYSKLFPNKRSFPTENTRCMYSFSVIIVSKEKGHKRFIIKKLLWIYKESHHNRSCKNVLKSHHFFCSSTNITQYLSLPVTLHVYLTTLVYGHKLPMMSLE